MKKETFYKLAIVILLILNVLQLIPFLLGFKKISHPEGNFREKAIKMMKLSKKQEQQFLKFAKLHRNKMVELNKKQLDLTSIYFKAPNDSLLNVISKVEAQKINTTENHFFEIKSILKKNQLKEFNQFKKEALQTILKGSSSKNAPRPPRRPLRE